MQDSTYLHSISSQKLDSNFLMRYYLYKFKRKFLACPRTLKSIKAEYKKYKAINKTSRFFKRFSQYLARKVLIAWFIFLSVVPLIPKNETDIKPQQPVVEVVGMAIGLRPVDIDDLSARTSPSIEKLHGYNKKSSTASIINKKSNFRKVDRLSSFNENYNNLIGKSLDFESVQLVQRIIIENRQFFETAIAFQFQNLFTRSDEFSFINNSESVNVHGTDLVTTKKLSTKALTNLTTLLDQLSSEQIVLQNYIVNNINETKTKIDLENCNIVVKTLLQIRSGQLNENDIQQNQTEEIDINSEKQDLSVPNANAKSVNFKYVKQAWNHVKKNKVLNLILDWTWKTRRFLQVGLRPDNSTLLEIPDEIPARKSPLFGPKPESYYQERQAVREQQTRLTKKLINDLLIEGQKSMKLNRDLTKKSSNDQCLLDSSISSTNDQCELPPSISSNLNRKPKIKGAVNTTPTSTPEVDSSNLSSEASLPKSASAKNGLRTSKGLQTSKGGRTKKPLVQKANSFSLFPGLFVDGAFIPSGNIQSSKLHSGVNFKGIIGWNLGNRKLPFISPSSVQNERMIQMNGNSNSNSETDYTQQFTGQEFKPNTFQRNGYSMLIDSDFSYGKDIQELANRFLIKIQLPLRIQFETGKLKAVLFESQIEEVVSDRTNPRRQNATILSTAVADRFSEFLKMYGLIGAFYGDPQLLLKAPGHFNESFPGQTYLEIGGFNASASLTEEEQIINAFLYKESAEKNIRSENTTLYVNTLSKQELIAMFFNNYTNLATIFEMNPLTNRLSFISQYELPAIEVSDINSRDYSLLQPDLNIGTHPLEKGEEKMVAHFRSNNTIWFDDYMYIYAKPAYNPSFDATTSLMKKELRKWCTSAVDKIYKDYMINNPETNIREITLSEIISNSEYNLFLSGDEKLSDVSNQLKEKFDLDLDLCPDRNFGSRTTSYLRTILVRADLNFRAIRKFYKNCEYTYNDYRNEDKRYPKFLRKNEMNIFHRVKGFDFNDYKTSIIDIEDNLNPIIKEMFPSYLNDLDNSSID